VRARVFTPADYGPPRLSALCCRHKLSGQALMAHLTTIALTALYPQGLPERLFWIADATYTEKPYAHRIASVDWFHRLKHVAGRAKHLKGHCYVFAAHLYTHGEGRIHQWASVLVGALLYVKGRSIPALVGVLAQQLRWPAPVRHLWLTDRGMLSRPRLRALGAQGHFALGRWRCHQRVYCAPRRRAPRQPRPRVCGPSGRVARWLTQLPQHLGQRPVPAWASGAVPVRSRSMLPTSSCMACGPTARGPRAWCLARFPGCPARRGTCSVLTAPAIRYRQSAPMRAAASSRSTSLKSKNWAWVTSKVARDKASAAGRSFYVSPICC
jgi:hypothetical protein